MAAKFLNTAMLALALVVVAIPVHARSEPDTKAIEAVFADYVAGLAKGDLGRLSAAFAPDGVFVSIDASTDGKPASVVSRPFKDVLASWAENPDATASGQITGIAIQNDNMATVQGELDFGTARYQDSLLLYKIAGRWTIVAKTTHARDRPDHSAPKSGNE